MILKRAVVSLIILCLVWGSLAACGNSEDNQGPANEGPSQIGDEQTDNQESEEDESSEVNEPSGVSWDDMAEINVISMVTSAVPNGLQAVEDAINEITEKEINTHVNFSLIEMGNYAQQISLGITSGEAVDLFVTMPAGPASFSTMASQSQLMDISNLLETYAPDIYEGSANILKNTTISGGIYGVPANKAFVTGINIYMRTDVLEDLGLLEKAENMTTLTEYEEILTAVKESEKWGSLAGIVSNAADGSILKVSTAFINQDRFDACNFFDNLGDTLGILGVDPDDQTSTVFNYYKTDEYQAMLEIVKRWYESGYIYKDAATTQEAGTALIKSNAAFSMLAQSEIGSESNVSISCGTPMTAVRIMKLPINTASVNKFVWTVPNTAKEPEAAVAFLNMAYSDTRIADLLAWGIEGIDFEYKENGTAGYIDGNESPAYHTDDTCYPNKLITTPWENNPPTLRQEQTEALKSADYSSYMGFSCDTSAISTEIGAVTNVLEEYAAQLHSGMAAEGTYDQFIQKLEAAGIDIIINEYQKQLDEWLTVQ